MLSYSIGIPARNEEKNIICCLDSLYNQSTQPEKIFVCVNGSTDNTLELIKEYKVNKNNLQILESGVGKMSAIKKILKQNYSEYILFVDADVVINEKCSEELYRKISNTGSLFAGTSLYRLAPMYNNFFTKISDVVYEKIDHQKFLNGKTYFFKPKLFFKHLEEMNLNIESVRDDLLNEDQFFELISRKFEGVSISEEAVTVCQPISNFMDWFKFRMRISRGRKQLVNQFPNLVNRNDFFRFRIRNYSHRLNLADNLYKKIGAILFPIIKELVYFYVFYIERSSNNSWITINSTKKIININKVLKP